MAHSEAIVLDVNKQSEYSIDPIRLRRGESGLTTIDATILDNGNPYNLSGCSVMFYSYDAKQDYIYESSTIKSSTAGTVSYTVSTRLTNQAGEIRVAYFRITNGSKTITTQNIPIIVLENVDLTGEEAEEYQSQFEKLLESISAMQSEVNGYLEDVQSVTDNANTAADAANAARANAETATESANVARDAANTAASGANSAAENATNASNAANELIGQVSGEWAQLKPTVENAASDARSATADANAAAQKANESAGKVDGIVEAAEKATVDATNAAEQTTQAIKNAYDAAGEAITAATKANDQVARVEEALDEFDTITGTEIAYAIGESSITPPEGTWTAARQECPQGSYEWVRTITHYAKAPDNVTYSVSYQGVDGLNGVGIESSTLYWLWTDPEGNLWATYSDNMNPPMFRYQRDTGNLYISV